MQHRGCGDDTPAQMIRRVKELEKQMYQHARTLEFEQAAGSVISLELQAGLAA